MGKGGGFGCEGPAMQTARTSWGHSTSMLLANRLYSQPEPPRGHCTPRPLQHTHVLCDKHRPRLPRPAHPAADRAPVKPPDAVPQEVPQVLVVHGAQHVVHERGVAGIEDDGEGGGPGAHDVGMGNLHPWGRARGHVIGSPHRRGERPGKRPPPLPSVLWEARGPPKELGGRLRGWGAPHQLHLAVRGLDVVLCR